MSNFIFKITGVNWVFKGKTIHQKTNRLLTLIGGYFALGIMVLFKLNNNYNGKKILES